MRAAEKSMVKQDKLFVIDKYTPYKYIQNKLRLIWLKKDIRISHKLSVGNNYLFLKFSSHHFNLFPPDLLTVGYIVLFYSFAYCNDQEI